MPPVNLAFDSASTPIFGPDALRFVWKLVLIAGSVLMLSVNAVGSLLAKGQRGRFVNGLGWAALVLNVLWGLIAAGGSVVVYGYDFRHWGSPVPPGRMVLGVLAFLAAYALSLLFARRWIELSRPRHPLAPEPPHDG